MSSAMDVGGFIDFLCIFNLGLLAGYGLAALPQNFHFLAVV